MAKIKSKDTKPEVLLRSQLFSRGYRYRKHHKVHSVSIDIAFTKKKIAIFVHGCFWHQHEGCIEASRPKTNTEYWNNKLKSNVERDKNQVEILKREGWRVYVLWECQILKQQDETMNALISNLERI